jgi:hypothetical protein
MITTICLPGRGLKFFSSGIKLILPIGSFIKVEFALPKFSFPKDMELLKIAFETKIVLVK